MEAILTPINHASVGPVCVYLCTFFFFATVSPVVPLLILPLPRKKCEIVGLLEEQPPIGTWSATPDRTVSLVV